MRTKMKEKRKLDTTNKVGIGIVCALVVLALTTIILHFSLFEFSFVSVINAGIICFITFILCIIFHAATHGKHEKKRERTIADDYVEERVTAKQFFSGLGVLLACGIGYIPLFILGGNNLQKINSPAYVKTEAIIMSVVDTSSTFTNPTSSPKYVYYDQDGNEIISKSSAQWGGITFKLGEKVTVYYNKANPEIMLNLSDGVMMIFGGMFFLFGGMLAFCGCTNRHHFVPFLFGLLFIIFSTGILTAMKLASGMNIFLLLASGALPYAMFLFLALGMFFVVYGVVDAIKYIRYIINNRKSSKAINESLKKEKDKNRKDETIKEKTQKLGKNYNKITAKIKNNEENENIDDEKLNEDGLIFDEPKVSKTKKKYKLYFTKEEFKNFFAMFFAGAVFFVTGLFVMIYVGIMPLAKTASFVKAEATVIELHTYYKDGGLNAYFDYEYFVDGKRYEKESSYGQSVEIAPAVGEKITIYYNPKNPDELTDSSWTDWISVAVGFIFAGVGAALIIVPLVKCRTEVLELKDENGTIQSNINEIKTESQALRKKQKRENKKG